MHLSNAKASIGMLNEIDYITKGLRNVWDEERK